MQDHTEEEDQVSGAGREVRGFGFEEVMRHEFEAGLQILWQCFLTGFERLGVVLDDEFGVGEALRDGLADVTAATSYLLQHITS